MRPGAVARQLQQLRDAGAALRRRPAHEVAAAVATALDTWRDPDSPWRARLETRLPDATGFSAPTVREGLRVALEAWTGDALLALAHDELGPLDAPEAPLGFDTTAVLLAGSIPMPSLLSLLTPLLLRSPVLAKGAARDPVTPKLVARSLVSVDEELAACLAVADFRHDDAVSLDALLAADCIVATGSDASVAAVRARAGPEARVIEHGHRFSLALLGPAACVADRVGDTAERLARDVALWDQLGCLSPIEAWVVGESEADAVAQALAEAFAKLETSLPRGAIDAHAAAAISHERAEAELRSAAGARVTLLASRDSTWTVVREETLAARPAPLHRFVRVVPAETTQALLEALRPAAAHLAGVAVAGFGAGETTLREALADLGTSWICAPGQLQAPPLSWRRGGVGVFAPLARFPAATPRV